MTSRRTFTNEDRQLQQEIEDSYKVSSYANKIAEAMETGMPIDPKEMGVPDYAKPAQPEPIHMNMMGLFSSAAGTLDDKGIERALADTHAPRVSDQSTFEKTASNQPAPVASTEPSFKASKNQVKALQKYPSLIEFLGQDEYGEKIAEKILADLRSFMIEKLGENAKLASKFATVCVVDKHNIKQFFQGEDWLCKITASGPFRGDETIYYSRDHDKAVILRKNGEEFYDVSSGFNMIAESREGILPEEALNDDQDTK